MGLRVETVTQSGYKHCVKIPISLLHLKHRRKRGFKLPAYGEDTRSMYIFFLVEADIDTLMQKIQ